MKRAVLGILIVGAIVAGTGAVAAGGQAEVGCVYDVLNDRYVCGGERSKRSEPSGPRLLSPTTTRAYDLLVVPELMMGPDGPCITTSSRDLGSQPTDMQLLQADTQFLQFLRAGYTMCPGAELPPATTPTLEAVRFLQEVGLPSPDPHIQPGRLPVGFDAYLETQAPTTMTFGPKPTPFGDLVLTARAQIYVDWDDPHDDVEGEHGPYDGEPGPYPDGEITHLYQYDGRYDITVRYEWVADWQIGGQGGTIPGAATTGTLPGFEVYSRQAVG